MRPGITQVTGGQTEVGVCLLTKGGARTRQGNLCASWESDLSPVVAQFEFYRCEASSRRPALSPAGRGIWRAPPRRPARDPSLRLKSDCARDDAIEEGENGKKF